MFDCIARSICCSCHEERCCALIRLGGKLIGFYCQECIFTLAPFDSYTTARRTAVLITYHYGAARFPSAGEAEARYHELRGTAILAKVFGEEVSYG